MVCTNLNGVNKEEMEIIQKIISKYKPKIHFFCYGSRVKGNFSETSDLDVLIQTEKKDSIGIIYELNEKFDNSKLPFIVNIIDMNKLDEKFLNAIKKDFIEI